MIRRQVLHRAVAGRHDGREIAGTELVDRGGRNASGRDRRLTDRNRAVEQDDDEPPLFLRRPGSSPHRSAPRASTTRRAAGGDRAGRPRVNAWMSRGWPSSKMVKSCGRQPSNRVSLAVEHRHVDLHEIGPAAERRLRHWRLSVQLQSDRNHRKEGDAGGAMFIYSPFERLG